MATDILGDRTRQQNRWKLPPQGLKMENQNVLNVDDAIKSQVMPYLPRLAKPLMKSLIVQWTMHKHIFFPVSNAIGS